MNENPAVIEPDKLVFLSEPSSVLQTAIKDFEESRQNACEPERRDTGEAWSA
jgi:hypothetical protein